MKVKVENVWRDVKMPTAAKDKLGFVKTTSDVTSSSGLTPCPIIGGVPYYNSSISLIKIYIDCNSSSTTVKINGEDAVITNDRNGYCYVGITFGYEISAALLCRGNISLRAIDYDDPVSFIVNTNASANNGGAIHFKPDSSITSGLHDVYYTLIVFK